MKKLFYLVGLIGAVSCSGHKTGTAIDSLKDAYKNKFYIGTSLNHRQSTGNDSLGLGILQKHFNSVVAENCMKSALLQPREGQFNFANADKFIETGINNDMNIIGHCLIWHSQAPRWFFIDENGNDVSREILIQRMKNHIYTVVGRYKDRVHGWDVVNEAVEDNGEMRNSKFYQIIGPEYIELAFKFANEADPNAELYYNDYNMAKKGKRDTVVKIINNLKTKGYRIDAVGMQSHCSLKYPKIEDYRNSIDAFINTGVNVMITELDVSVLPELTDGAAIESNFKYNEDLNPYKDFLPDDIDKALAKRYADLFEVYNDYSDNISRVTFWGITDGDSWKNNWPVRGRTDYPLAFDRDYQPKSFVFDLIKMGQKK